MASITNLRTAILPFLFCSILSASQGVESLVINEVMSSPPMAGEEAGFNYYGRLIRSDWVEIYNPTSETVDLTGLRLSDDCLQQEKWEIKPEAELEVPPYGYIVIWCPGTFLGTYNCGTEDQPEYCPVPIPPDKAPFRLNAGGEWIGLYKEDGQTLIDGFQIPSLPRNQTYGCVPDGDSGKRVYLSEPTLGKSNSGLGNVFPQIEIRSYRGIVYGEGGEVTDYTLPPLKDSQDVRICVRVRDADDPDRSDLDDNIREVRLHWKVMGYEEHTVLMEPPEKESEWGLGKYEAVIPGQPEDHVIAFYVEASDKEGNTSEVYWSDFFNPDADPPVWFQYPVGRGQASGIGLLINEVLASNPDTPPWYEAKDPAAYYDLGGHDHGAGTEEDRRNEADDWVELYNRGEEPVSLAGTDLYLTNNELFPLRFDVAKASALSPKSTNVESGTLPGGKHLLVWCDGEPWQDDSVGIHADFNLTAREDEIFLIRYRDDDGDWEPEEFVILDVVSWGPGEAEKGKWFGPQDADWSLGRYPDGGEKWGRMLPTPGANYYPGAPNSGFVPYLNVTRFSPEKPGREDEIKMVACVWDDEKLPYNENLEEENWFGVKLVYTAASSEPPVYERAVAMRDDGNGGDECGGDGIYSGIMESGLSGPVYYKVTALDSAGNKAAFPRKSNVYGMLYVAPAPEGAPVISEAMASTSRCPCEGECDVMYDADGDFDDWVEIYNPTDSAVYLGDYYLTDRMDWLSRWRFPWETADSSALTLEPQERLIVWCDGEEGEQTDESGAFSGEFHTNFRLNAGSDEIYLAGGEVNRLQVVDYLRLRRYPHEVRPEDRIANVSFGSKEDSGQAALLLEPTPGEPNRPPAAQVQGIKEQGSDPSKPQPLEPGSRITVTGEALEQTEEVFVVPLLYEETGPNQGCDLCTGLDDSLTKKVWSWEGALPREEIEWQLSGGEVLVTLPGSLKEGKEYLLCVLSGYNEPSGSDSGWPLPWYEGGVPWSSIGFVAEGGTAQPQFRRGDINGDSGVDIGDAVFLLNWLFAEKGSVTCPDAADANDDGELNIADAVYTLNYLFGGGPALPPPAGECGTDPTADTLPGCVYSGSCGK